MKNKIFIFLLVILALWLPSCSENLNEVFKNDVEYDVTNTHFEVVDFELLTITGFNTKTGTSQKSYVVEFTSKCDLPLTEYSIDVSVYTSNNKLLSSETIEEIRPIDSHEHFVETVEVPKDLDNPIKTVKVTYSGKSSQKPSSTAIGSAKVMEFCTVTFYNESTPLAEKIVKKGSNVEEWDAPYKNNYVFSQWCSDSSKTQKFNFSSKILQDTNIYASYVLDATKLFNKVHSETMKSVVTIYNKEYDKDFWGRIENETTWNGSGVILNISNGYCYILTADHIIEKETGDYQNLTVEDYRGRTYEAKIYKKNNVPATSSTYRLAIVYFKAPPSDLEVIHFSQDINVGDDIIAIGWHNGQKNTVSHGNILKYGEPPNGYSNKIKFDVITHNAIVTSLHSGGPLLNSDLNLIGLQITNVYSTNEGIAIPTSKIWEFWELYTQ